MKRGTIASCYLQTTRPAAKRYPVIYYFHGHSDRYTVEKYDNGTDTIPKMAAFVSKNDVDRGVRGRICGTGLHGLLWRFTL